MEPLFRFGNPTLLPWLFLIPVLVFVFIVMILLRKSAIKRFGKLALLKKLMPDESLTRITLKFTVFIIAVGLMLLGIARPQFGSKLEEVKKQGVEIVIALDVSNSMLAEDIKPNRLEKSKLAISSLVSKLTNDRIALIVFAGEAYTQMPMTTDYGAAKMFLSTINTGYVERQGTAIGAAVELGIKSFNQESPASKALIIISDGENHEDAAFAKIKDATDKGIIIHTIGMGLPQGAPIPVYGRYQKEYRKDRDGNIVISKLNEEMLQQIADEGNGVYVRASNASAGLNVIYDEISKMDKTQLESKIYTDFDEKFQYLFGIAFILLILELLFAERKNKLFKNIKIF